MVRKLLLSALAVLMATAAPTFASDLAAAQQKLLAEYTAQRKIMESLKAAGGSQSTDFLLAEKRAHTLMMEYQNFSKNSVQKQVTSLEKQTGVVAVPKVLPAPTTINKEVMAAYSQRAVATATTAAPRMAAAETAYLNQVKRIEATPGLNPNEKALLLQKAAATNGVDRSAAPLVYKNRLGLTAEMIAKNNAAQLKIYQDVAANFPKTISKINSVVSKVKKLSF